MMSGIIDKVSQGEYLKAWRQFKDEHPVAYGVSAVLPVSGQAAAAADYADAMDRGDSLDGAIAAASFLPGIGLAKAGKAIGKLKVAPARTVDLSAIGGKSAGAWEKTVEQAPNIGRAADAEQIGEISGKEYRKNKEEEAKAKARQEFSKAFGEQG